MILNLSEQEVEFLDDLLAGALEEGVPMDKLDEYKAGTYIDPAESLLERIRIGKAQKDKEETQIEFYQEDVYKMLDGMNFNAGNIEMKIDDNGDLIIRAERVKDEN